jgi:hypothetical protein
LGALAGTGLADDDDDGVLLNGLEDLFFVLDDGKGRAGGGEWRRVAPEVKVWRWVTSELKD